MTLIKIIPRKNYRLHDGSLGTEYDALKEAIKILKNEQQRIEDKLEELTKQLESAEGMPEYYFNSSEFGN